MRMASRSPVGFGAHSRRRVGALDLHVVEAGPPDGPPAILLHGFPEFWWGWRRQIAPLAAAGLRVVAPDQRGYNLSDKPGGVAAYALDALADDVLGLADVFGRARFAVAGHDWGAAVAWHLAGRNPGRVERAAALNGAQVASALGYARAPLAGVAELVRGLLPGAVAARTGARRRRPRVAALGAGPDRPAGDVFGRGPPALPRRLGAPRRADRDAELVPRLAAPRGVVQARAHPRAGARGVGRPRRLP